MVRALEVSASARRIVPYSASPNKDAKANDLLDEFEELIQQYDSYGAFRRLAAKRLGVPVIRVTIQEINEFTKQVHQAYADFPNRLNRR